MKKIPNLQLVILLMISMLFATCNKVDSFDNSYDNGNIADIAASVKGRIINEKNEPVNGVSIKCGNATTTTDLNGEFLLNNTPLNSSAACYSN